MRIDWTMDVALVVVSILLAVLIAFSAALKLTHRPKVVESYRTAGVPETWLNWLAALLLAAAGGLVVGIWWPIAGIAAAGGLVVYFVLAVGFHIHANDTAHVVTPAVLAGVAASVVALHIAHL
jgi:DoxX-like family